MQPKRIISWDDSAAIQFEEAPEPVVVCGLGMRPEYITHLGKSIYYPDKAEWYQHMDKQLTDMLRKWLERYPVKEVISSLALGFETALAEAALKCHLPYHAVLPFDHLPEKWSPEHKTRFQNLLAKATTTYTISPGPYKPWKQATALLYRVSKSDIVLTLWDGQEKHIKAALAVVKKEGKEAINVWDSWKLYGLI
jgi:uncharacterized phage-like protein YoqJ